jgi:hypothetical protein
MYCPSAEISPSGSSSLSAPMVFRKVPTQPVSASSRPFQA